MSAVKEKLVSRIQDMKPTENLEALWNMVSGMDDEGVYHLTTSQKRDIEESLKQIADGKTVSNHKLIAEILNS